MSVEMENKVSFHPFQDFIEDYLRSIGLDPLDTKEERKDNVTYSIRANEKLNVFFTIYLSGNVAFAFFEATLGKVDSKNEACLAVNLLNENYNHYFPMWLSFTLREGGTYAALVFRTYLDGITEEHFKLRVESLVELGLRLQEKYMEKIEPPVREENSVEKQFKH